MKNSAHVDGNGNIVIQEVNGSTITINPNNSAEIRQLIMDFGSKLNELPTDILKILNEKQNLESEIKVGANIYLTVLSELYENKIYNKLKFGLTITNTTKENRYFGQPFFKVWPKFELEPGLEHDTFTMVPEQGNVFPKKLEYGEPYSVSYEIKPLAFKMYEGMLTKNQEAYIQCFVNTTVGELYESNQYLIKNLLENLKWIKNDRSK